MKIKEQVAVVIPVFNEEELLVGNVQRLHSYLTYREISHEIIVVSNGSTDNTVEVGEKLAQDRDWLTFKHIQPRGVGRAFKEGCLLASADIIVSVDIDLPSELQFLEYAYKLRGDYDLLIGSKFMGYQQRSPLRLIGSQLYVLLTQFFFGLTVSDYSPDSKAYRRELIVPLLEHFDPWTGYVLEASLAARLKKKRILQVSIDVNDTRISSFNLFYEGYYRYLHFFKTWFALRSSASWFHSSQNSHEWAGVDDSKVKCAPGT